MLHAATSADLIQPASNASPVFQDAQAFDTAALEMP